MYTAKAVTLPVTIETIPLIEIAYFRKPQLRALVSPSH